MLILGIDTSTKLCSVALYDTEKGLLGEMNIHVPKNHSNVILPLIDSLFRFTGKSIQEIQRIAVGIGPGSFTGIRVGLAIAKGFAIGKALSFVGVSNLDALAYQAARIFEKGKIFSLIDARKERVYYRVFEKKKEGWEALTEAKDGELRTVLVELAQEGDCIFVGDGALAYRSIIEEHCGSRAKILGEEWSLTRALSFAMYAESQKEDNLYTLEPLYVTKSQAEKTKAKA